MLKSYHELQCGARGMGYIVAASLISSGCPEFSQVSERKKKVPRFFLSGIFSLFFLHDNFIEILKF